MTQDQLTKLKAPFRDEELGAVVVAQSEKETDQGYTNWMTVRAYLSDAHIENRLDDVAPEWQFRITDLSPTTIPERRAKRAGSGPTGTAGVAAIGELSLNGTTRMAVGSDADARAASTYAFKSAAGKFGIGRFLDLDSRYTLRLGVKDKRTANRFVYDRLNWAQALELARGMGVSTPSPRQQPTPTPQRTPEVAPEVARQVARQVPTPKPQAMGPGEPKPWHKGLQQILQAKGLSDGEALSLAAKRNITNGSITAIEELTLDQTNAVLTAIREG